MRNNSNNARLNAQARAALTRYRLALFGFQCPCSCGNPVKVDHGPLSGGQKQILISGCCEEGRAKATEIVSAHIMRNGGERM
jgi:hypothetical protein